MELMFLFVQSLLDKHKQKRHLSELVY